MDPAFFSGGTGIPAFHFLPAHSSISITRTKVRDIPARP
jgi:hypothetical protein